jgi:hypothetical protein
LQRNIQALDRRRVAPYFNAIAKGYRQQLAVGEVSMKEFVLAVVAAVIVGVISVYALDMYQKPAGVAYTSQTGVRL